VIPHVFFYDMMQGMACREKFVFLYPAVAVPRIGSGFDFL